MTFVFCIWSTRERVACSGSVSCSFSLGAAGSGSSAGAGHLRQMSFDDEVCPHLAWNFLLHVLQVLPPRISPGSLAPLCWQCSSAQQPFVLAGCVSDSVGCPFGLAASV
jgi:hypothetical protein